MSDVPFLKRWAFVPLLVLACAVLVNVTAPHATTVAKWIFFALVSVVLGRVWDRRRRRTWPR